MNSAFMDGDRLLNTKEAARFLRVSEASIRRWSDSGLLPARRVGRRRERRFTQADLEQFLGQRSGHPHPAATTPQALTIAGVSVPIRSHIAPLYSTDAGGLRLTVPFLADGLKAQQPCFLIASGPVLERYVKALTEEHAIDFAAATRSGALVVLPSPGSNPAEAIATWERLMATALAGGPTILRIVGEMASVRPNFASDAELLIFEEAYDVMARRFPAVSLCQYDVREFSGESVLRVLKAHPDIFEKHLGGFLN
jgi:transcriptional repressor of dcmA and dcmR